MNLPLIPLDKANHFIYGFGIFFLINLFLSNYWALGGVIVFALAKEIKDQILYKGFDYKDFLISLLPGVLLFLKSIIIK
jgi:hypothetical protein